MNYLLVLKCLNEKANDDYGRELYMNDYETVRKTYDALVPKCLAEIEGHFELWLYKIEKNERTELISLVKREQE